MQTIKVLQLGLNCMSCLQAVDTVSCKVCLSVWVSVWLSYEGRLPGHVPEGRPHPLRPPNKGVNHQSAAWEKVLGRGTLKTSCCFQPIEQPPTLQLSWVSCPAAESSCCKTKIQGSGIKARRGSEVIRDANVMQCVLFWFSSFGRAWNNWTAALTRNLTEGFTANFELCSRMNTYEKYD